MAEGFVSDIDGDDTVMESPEVTISIDLEQLPPEQALAIAGEAGFDQQEAYILGQMLQGDDDYYENDVNDAVFHVPLGPALTILDQMGVVDLPEDPSDVDVASGE